MIFDNHDERIPYYELLLERKDLEKLNAPKLPDGYHFVFYEPGDRDAWIDIDKYLDEALLVGVNSVTIVHGKGTGALRKGLWEFFRRDSRIKKHRNGEYGEGDFGVTVLELK